MKSPSTPEHPWVGKVRRISAALSEIISILKPVINKVINFACKTYVAYKLFIQHWDFLSRPPVDGLWRRG